MSKIIQNYHMDDLSRYYFDEKECAYQNGWAQLDTYQDAHYFGMWINPRKLRILTYCEGDITEVQYDNIEEIKTILPLLDENIRIDPGLNPKFKHVLIDIGLSDFLH